MKFRILIRHASPNTVTKMLAKVCDRMDRAAYKYEVDYELIFGAGWAHVGIEVVNTEALALVTETITNYVENEL